MAYKKIEEAMKDIDLNITGELLNKKCHAIRTQYKQVVVKLIRESMKSGAGTDEVQATKLWFFPLLDFLFGLTSN